MGRKGKGKEERKSREEGDGTRLENGGRRTQQQSISSRKESFICCLHLLLLEPCFFYKKTLFVSDIRGICFPKKFICDGFLVLLLEMSFVLF